MTASRATPYRKVTAALVEQRQSPRHRVTVTQATVTQATVAGATGHLHDDRASNAVLHDLSIYGCRLQSSVLVEVEERLWLRLAGGPPIAATAIWCRDGFLGCRFDAPIGSALVRDLTLEA